MFDFAKMFELQGKLDKETLVLLGRLVIRALKEPDTNGWLRSQLERILNDPTPPIIRAEVRQCQPTVRRRKP